MRLITPLILFVTIFSYACTSMTEKIPPRKLGEKVTYAYLFAKDKLDVKRQQRVEKVYKVFKQVMEVATDVNAYQIRDRLKDSLDSEFERKVVDHYWDRIAKNFKLEELNEKEHMRILTEFFKGIEEAL